MIRPDGVVLFSRRFPTVERRARLTAMYLSSEVNVAAADATAQPVEPAHSDYVRLPADAFLVPELIQSFTDTYERRPPVLAFTCHRLPYRPFALAGLPAPRRRPRPPPWQRCAGGRMLPCTVMRVLVRT